MNEGKEKKTPERSLQRLGSSHPFWQANKKEKEKILSEENH